MDPRVDSSAVNEIRRAIRNKEGEISELDLLLNDYLLEHSRLLCELQKLQAQLCEAEDLISHTPEPDTETSIRQ